MSNCSPFTSIDWFYGLRARICGDCQVVEKTAVSISHYVANDRNQQSPLFLIGDRSRQRRRRTAFTDEQLNRLEDSFEAEKFPGIQIRENLAEELNIGEDRIQVRWLIDSYWQSEIHHLSSFAARKTIRKLIESAWIWSCCLAKILSLRRWSFIISCAHIFGRAAHRWKAFFIIESFIERAAVLISP